MSKFANIAKTLAVSGVEADADGFVNLTVEQATAIDAALQNADAVALQNQVNTLTAQLSEATDRETNLQTQLNEANSQIARLKTKAGAAPSAVATKEDEFATTSASNQREKFEVETEAEQYRKRVIEFDWTKGVND